MAEYKDYNIKTEEYWECGIGWRKLYQPIVDDIKQLNIGLPEDEKIRILQIKEKFGGLRIYLNYYPAIVRDRIDEAERLSYGTCEQCGATENTGLLYYAGWIYNCCRDCAKKIITRRRKDSYFKDEDKIKLFWEDTKAHKRYIIDSDLNFIEINKNENIK